MPIVFTDVVTQTRSHPLSISNWTIQENQNWGIFCAKGDIGEQLYHVLSQSIELKSGQCKATDLRIAYVSLSQQQALLEQELADDDTDFMDRFDNGSTVRELLLTDENNQEDVEKLIQQLDLEHLLDRGFRLLSTGETRRLMLARAVLEKPDLLILDEPYTGLDIAHRTALAPFLEALSAQMQLLILVSRENELPEWIEHIALFDNGKLTQTLTKSEWRQHPIINQINAQTQKQSEQVLALYNKYQHQTEFSDPLVELTDGKVEYTDQKIFSGVNWQIRHHQHWQIRGPNGCGKSTLLGLIFGDHPQCYSNDIRLFDMKRGNGETVWDIKKHIGMVSSALHLQYRVSCKAIEVVLSGFYDSIGLYEAPSKTQVQMAQEWLAIFHMSDIANHPFRELEYGQQRLLLIARALIKRPALLILDEPYQGLDFLGRRLVMNSLELIAKHNLSQLLFVSHYEEDAIESIHHFVDFVPSEDGESYVVKIT
ncbi:putative molybdenum transport ATP-binding protein ModF [Vibrio nigripulchritudo MADA3029]|uniref:molybdate ABC transporter ATP-binding protein ModF n=1 Tax=Vibrio nigripulchritudo TaxID=28173 RepID=UPI0003B1A1B2|nr:molybdate ABC transporter ATP-binding protein ModF [Vibrio nigripulchritudo]CCN47171.1 putative molybdenum transport ATP-binding protein ModF [Vibrio nigripulchritudo MADA3020]CCN55427.1 putative molybdenum transport ATP-binding protein ModF [Vibrio nigripulchritudo MADA3021]CCN60381.1 putative molybdenum transport ATP-binding protein ModF [Vibrio nigripulchritudo MADA3029]